MQISISARHGHLSTASQEKITEKVQKLSRFFDRLTAIHVTADLEHEESPSVELRVLADHSPDFVAVEVASTLMASLDGALHKMEKQLRRYKDKLTEHRGKGLGQLSSASEVQSKPSETDDVDDDDYDEGF